jgi:GTP-binding protein
MELQKAARKKPLLLSAVSGAGVREALLRVGKIVREPKAEAPKPASVWQPEMS